MVLIRGFLVKVLLIALIAISASTSFGFLSLDGGFKIAKSTNEIDKIFIEQSQDVLEISYCKDPFKKDRYVIILDTKNKLYRQSVNIDGLSVFNTDVISPKTTPVDPWWLYAVMLFAVLIWPMPRKRRK